MGVVVDESATKVVFKFATIILQPYPELSFHSIHADRRSSLYVPERPVFLFNEGLSNIMPSNVGHFGCPLNLKASIE